MAAVLRCAFSWSSALGADSEISDYQCMSGHIALRMQAAGANQSCGISDRRRRLDPKQMGCLTRLSDALVLEPQYCSSLAFCQDNSRPKGSEDVN